MVEQKVKKLKAVANESIDKFSIELSKLSKRMQIVQSVIRDVDFDEK